MKRHSTLLKKTTKVLVVATSPNTMGGVSSVVKAYQQCDMWGRFHCYWVATHSDKGSLYKLLFLLRGWLCFILLLPFYDLVHVHVSEPPSAMRKCLFMPFAKLFKKKVIVHFHSFSSETTVRSRWAYLYEYLFGRADVIIALSPYWKHEISNALPNIDQDKIRILYNPCTSEPFEEEYSKRKIILFAGILNKRKGYEDLINGFALIAHKHTEWKLVLAGSGEMEKARDLAVRCGISNRVELAGWVRGKEKDRLFKESSIFCLPSYAEGFPMAVLDAWAYGLPVVSTPVGGLPDIAVDGKNVLLCPVGDIPALADQLERVITDDELRQELSREAKKMSDNVFDKKIITAQLERIYLDLFDKK